MSLVFRLVRAGSRLAGSLRGQMNSCRLGRSGRLAVAANIAAVRS